MAKTGHRSTDGVRQYKRVNDEQLHILSQVAQGQVLQPHKNPLKESDMNATPPNPPEAEVPGKIERAVVPKLENETENGPFPALHFANCSITINFK